MIEKIYKRIAGRFLLAILFTAIMIVNSINVVQGASRITFSDVKYSDWFYEDVTTLVSKGIVSGYSDLTFRPDNVVTVAEFLKMSLEAMNKDLVKVNGGKWYDTYVQTAIKGGIIGGNEYNDYDRPIKRFEMASIVDKLLRLNTNYRDEYYSYIKDLSDINSKYISSAVDVFVAGIITGYDDGTIRGNNNAKRSEASTVIIRMLDKSKRQPFQKPVIELGMSLDKVKEFFGTSYVRHVSQYGYTWYCYVNDYNTMDFVGVSGNKVVAYYTNYNFTSVDGYSLTWAGERHALALDGKIDYWKTWFIEDERSSNKIYEYYFDETGAVSGLYMASKSFTEPTTITNEVVDDMEMILFYLINGTRARHGLAPLTYCEDASQVASSFSRYLVPLSGLTHTDAEGNNSKARMIAAGIPATAGYGENVAKGYRDPFKMHFGFVNSPGHLPNIISDIFQYVGIGIHYEAGDKYYYYTTEDYYKPGQ